MCVFNLRDLNLRYNNNNNNNLLSNSRKLGAAVTKV
jgi:hypothetical protein